MKRLIIIILPLCATLVILWKVYGVNNSQPVHGLLSVIDALPLTLWEQIKTIFQSVVDNWSQIDFQATNGVIEGLQEIWKVLKSIYYTLASPFEILIAVIRWLVTFVSTVTRFLTTGAV